MQHHDTVTGTSKRYVIEDEIRGLEKLINDNANHVSSLIKNEAKLKGIDIKSLTMMTHKVNEVQTKTYEFGNKNEMLFVVYNPSALPVSHALIQVDQENIEVEVWNVKD